MLRAFGIVVALTFAAGAARADVLVLSGDLQGGGMYGQGVSGDPTVKDQAFFANVANTTYGVAASGRFLFLGATLQHHQYAGLGAPASADPMSSGGKLATWTQLVAGLDFAVDLGSDAEKKKHEGAFVQIGLGAGFGVGTGQQVDPPLSNDQIDDKAFLVEAKLGYGKHLNKHLDFGLLVPITYGYFIKNGVPANNVDNHYQGVHGEALLFLRLRIKVL